MDTPPPLDPSSPGTSRRGIRVRRRAPDARAGGAVIARHTARRPSGRPGGSRSVGAAAVTLAGASTTVARRVRMRTPSTRPRIDDSRRTPSERRLRQSGAAFRTAGGALVTARVAARCVASVQRARDAFAIASTSSALVIVVGPSIPTLDASSTSSAFLSAPEPSRSTTSPRSCISPRWRRRRSSGRGSIRSEEPKAADPEPGVAGQHSAFACARI
jgi:hypothetical protein